MSAAGKPLGRRFPGRLGRRTPQGLSGPGLLLPSRDPRQKVHREIWWAARPPHRSRAVWRLAQFALWLRWIGWPLWRQTLQSLRTRGAEVRAQEGISLRRQAAVLLRLGVGWSIPPRDVYRFRLYRRPQAALDYVFDHELTGWHRLHSPGADAEAQRRLFADKLRFAERLSADGLSLVPTQASQPRGSTASLVEELAALPAKPAGWFCKTRSGHAGLGAFAVWRQGAVLARAEN